MNELEKIVHQEAIKEAGLYFLERKISIIPVGKNKRPLIKWDEFNDRHATPEEFLAWTEKFPDMQLGAVMGKISMTTAIDIETDGVPLYTDIPTNCPIYKTGKGGRHYWCTYEPRAKTGVRLREFLDIRNDRSYVIVPPSMSDYGSYEWMQKIDHMPFPSNLLPKPTGNQQFDKIPVYGGVIEDYEGSGEGGRNDAMTRYAGKILPEIHPLDWDTDGWARFVTANLKNNPPLPEYELRTTWESIKAKEKANPSLRSFQKQEQEEIVLDSNGEIVDDSIVAIRIAASLEEENLGDPIPTGIPSLDEALLGGVRPGDLVTISGMSGHGKTSISQTIAANMAETGIPILFFTYEVMVSEICDKFEDMKLGDDVMELVRVPKKTTSRQMDWVKKKVLEGKEQGITVVIIDHLEYLLSSAKQQKNVSMNFSNKMSETVKEVKDLARTEGVIIILMYHLRKVNQGIPTLNDAKDSISIVQESDICLILERDANINAKATMGEFFLPTSTLSLQKNRRKGGKTFYIKMGMLQGRLVELGVDGSVTVEDGEIIPSTIAVLSQEKQLTIDNEHENGRRQDPLLLA